MKRLSYLLITLLFISCAKEEVLNIYEVSIQPTEQGMVIGTSGTMMENDLVEVYASPNTDGVLSYKFSYWSIKVGTSIIKDYNNPTTISVSDNIVITPQFELNKFEEDIIYGSIIERDFKSYLRAFIKDAKRWGVDLSHVDVESSELRLVDNTDYLGASIGYRYPSVAIIEIRKSSWNELSKEDIVKVLWHEFGHDILGLDHLCMSGEIMSGQHQECKGPESEGEYYNVWKLSYNNQDMSKNFQRGLKNMFNGTNQVFLSIRNSFTDKGTVTPIRD